MANICLWAPHCRLVELESRGRIVGMTRKVRGWWGADVPFIHHGSDYTFRLDGQGPFPDPRSAWQPEGVHGPSRWVDHSRFLWNDSGWRQPPLASSLIYELHVGTFSKEGTFEGVMSHLNHLIKLGVTHVELMPVAEFSGNRGWGYDGVDLYAPHHTYGGPEGLKHLVDICHCRGLAVVLDVVYNHLGPEGNYLGHFGPYFTDRYATPWGQAVNLDGPWSDEVRRFFIDNALMWLRDYHLDGLRIDAVHAIVDTSAVHFLEQLAGEVEDLEAHEGRHMVLIAESDLNDPRIVRSPRQGGYGINAQWNEDFHHALHAFLTGEQDGYYEDFGQLSNIAKSMTQGFVYDGRYSRYRHRSHGRPAVGISGHRFVGCLQNHDQVGNRAMGERTAHLLSPAQLKIGAALVMTAPFIPMLFQGEEWAALTPFMYFTDHQDADLGEAVKRGRSDEFASFGWEPDKLPDPQEEETFRRSKLNWDELQHNPHKNILDWYRFLIKLRREVMALSDGRMDRLLTHFDESAGWLIMTRGAVLLACNFSETVQRIHSIDLAKKKIILSSEKGVLIENNEILLPGYTVAIAMD